MNELQIHGIGGRLITVDTGLFINNEFRPASNDERIEVENPTTGAAIGTLSAAASDDVDAAVSAASKAFESTWRSVLPTEKGRLLRRLADLIERDADELASIEAVDAGILFVESKNLHIAQAVETLQYFAGWADKLTGQHIQIPQGYAYTRREALGVCAAIVPWNSPLMITCWKLAPAIAAGNTLIIKTPELAPLYGQKLARLVKEAGFPPGVINIICGLGAIAGEALARHPDVKKIAFTGSGPVGRRILRAAADTNLKKVTLELGGKGPSIIFPDADFNNAIFWATLGITANNGQVCAAGSRIYVHSKIYNSFLAAFGDKIAQTAHGNPLDPNVTKGPVISKAQKGRILKYISQAVNSNVRILAGGQSITGDGHFVSNIAFADVPNGNCLMKEEVFGPVASINRFETEAEVISMANDSPYGLSAAIFTNDVNRSQRVSAALECGQVTVNCWGALNANTPFGGVKESGFGRDMGEEALDSWLTTKVVKHNILPINEG